MVVMKGLVRAANRRLKTIVRHILKCSLGTAADTRLLPAQTSKVYRLSLASEQYANGTLPFEFNSTPPALGTAAPNTIPWDSFFPNSPYSLSDSLVLIDARSPTEFAEDHLTGAVNIPVLSDSQRTEVGKLFSSGNVLEARLRGASYACTNIAESLADVQNPNSLALILRSGGSKQAARDLHRSTQSNRLRDAHMQHRNPFLLVYCWRGGQRSLALATILSEIGWPGGVGCLDGGYRAWRRLILRQLDMWPLCDIHQPLWVLSGLTGSGKTLILNELEASGAQVLDLERLANHKGSLFGEMGGGDDEQSIEHRLPTQRQFERDLHSVLHHCRCHDDTAAIWIECESRSIGPRCRLPTGLWRRLRNFNLTDVCTRRVWLDVPEDARVSWILKDYGDWLHDSERLDLVLQSLSCYHEKSRLEKWRSMISRDDFQGLVVSLLRDHYDPLYKKSRGAVLREFANAGLLCSVRVRTISHESAAVSCKLTTFQSFGWRSIRSQFICPISSLTLEGSLSFRFPSDVRYFHSSSGLGRKPGIQHPHHLSWQWAIQKQMDLTQYTVDPLRKIRNGGRGPDGHIQYKHVTKGLHMPYFLVDYNRSRQIKERMIHEEVILKIVKNWWQDPLLALVASGEVKRWITATSTMKEGDNIQSHWQIPNIPVLPVAGDAYPIGALPVGTQVCLIELYPGDGAVRCRSAGTSATVIRRGTSVHDLVALESRRNDRLLAEDIEDQFTCSLQFQSTRQEARLLPTCVVVVGQVSNENHNKQKYRKFGEKYWHGIKQRSGLYQKKTGRFGRKLHPVEPVLNCTNGRLENDLLELNFTLSDVPEFTREQEKEVFFDNLLSRRRRPIRSVPSAYNGPPHSLPVFAWRHN